MYDPGQLKNFLHKAGSQRDKALIALGAGDRAPKSIRQVIELLVSSGERAAGGWNLSRIFKGASGLAIRTNNGWELTDDGIGYVLGLGLPIKSSIGTKVASSLRKKISSISSQQTKDFITEALACFESSHFRAAVVLSWVGAVNLLYEYVIQHKLAEFNSEAKRRNSKWKEAKTLDDITSLKEHEFLQIVCAISIIGKNVKQELEQRLILRNGCGHPNSLKIGESAAANHLEVLIMNVYDHF